jgi:predicted alpha/beta superfamily hydrolase
MLCAGLFGAAGSRAAEPTAAAACESTATGDLRLHSLESRIFGNTRTIRVLLPPGYDAVENAQKRYPVLYLLDGQNLFDVCANEFNHQEWGVDETVQRLVGEGRIAPLIVVGVDHAGKGRAHEYLPYKDNVGNPDMPEPAGKRFPDFLVNEVMPLVDGKYRTLQGLAHTGIGGSSYGGAAALHALMARPFNFGHGLIESPTMWIGMGQLVRDTSPLVAMPRRVFVAFGGKESEDPAGSALMIGLVRQLETNFKAAGHDERSFRLVVEPEARHSEPDWARRLPGALMFLYGE